MSLPAGEVWSAHADFLGCVHSVSLVIYIKQKAVPDMKCYYVAKYMYVVRKKREEYVSRDTGKKKKNRRCFDTYFSNENEEKTHKFFIAVSKNKLSTVVRKHWIYLCLWIIF